MFLQPKRCTVITTHRQFYAQPDHIHPISTMHLMYTLDEAGSRVYTLKKVVDGKVTKSAHPARFSPDDKWSRQRVTLKRRFNLLLTQQSKFSASYSTGNQSKCILSEAE